MKGIAPVALITGLSVCGTALAISLLLHLIGKRRLSAIGLRCTMFLVSLFGVYIVLETKVGVGRMIALYIGFAAAALFGTLFALSLKRLQE